MFQTTPKSLRLSKISRLFETCTRNYLFFFFNSCSRARTLARVERKNDSDRLFKHSFNSNFVESASRSHRKILQKNGVIASLYKQCTVYEKRSEKSFCPSLSSDRYLLDFPQCSAYYLKKKKRERERKVQTLTRFILTIRENKRQRMAKRTASKSEWAGRGWVLSRDRLPGQYRFGPYPKHKRPEPDRRCGRVISPFEINKPVRGPKFPASGTTGPGDVHPRKKMDPRAGFPRQSPYTHFGTEGTTKSREREKEREREDRWYRQPVHHRLHPDTIPTGRSLWKPDTCWSGLPSNRTSTHRISAPSTPPTCRFSVVRCPFVRDVSPLLAPSVYLLRSGLSLWSMTRASFVSRGFALKGWIIIERYTKITRR